MSLINQMLRDLESRQRPDTDERGVIAGMGNPGRGTSRRGLLTSLLVLVFILALATAYLLWQQNLSVNIGEPSIERPATAAAVEATPVARPRTTPAPAPSDAGDTPGTESDEPTTPLLVEKAPVSAETPSTKKTPSVSHPQAIESAHRRSDETDTVAQKRPVPAVKTAASTTDEEEAGSRIEKRLRPMRPEQLAEQRYQAGYGRLQQGDKHGAELQWQQALAIDPAHIAAREALSALYLSQSRRVEAAEQLQQGLQHHPGHGQLALLYARLQVENGDHAGAVRVMQHALQESPQNADFHAFLAAIYQRQGDYQNSIAAYQHALSQQPGQGIWWMGIGISLEKAGKGQEALSAYREAIDSSSLSAQLRDYVNGRIKVLE
ncbi:MAG: tetratricopeptide repeat protein [Gammaproteobacteria bacterium]|nr:tetratricopeptide repeat protein [Gammaproteobacteria bacterium]